MGIFVRGLYILVAIAFVFLLYVVTVWVLEILGLPAPAQILKIVFVILGLLAVIGGLTGRYDNWWRNGPVA